MARSSKDESRGFQAARPSTRYALEARAAVARLVSVGLVVGLAVALATKHSSLPF